jgi:hypothetical protein
VTLFAASIYWDLPILLIAFSLVYSATRHDRWDRILTEALGWGLRVGGFLLTVGVVLFIASSYPDHWPYLAAVGGVGLAIYWWVSHRLAKKAAKTAAPPPAAPVKK